MYVFEKETHKFIGSSGFHNINWDVPRVEIGYWLDSRFTGKGFMTEAVKALTERSGFTLEGILINQDVSTDGTLLTDTMIFAKTV